MLEHLHMHVLDILYVNGRSPYRANMLDATVKRLCL